MWQEQRREETYTESTSGPWFHQRAKEGAHRWLARFAPLLDGVETLSADECRSRLELLRDLRAESGQAIANLEARKEPEDAALLTTLQAATAQLDALEADLKRRLGLLAPGDPEGMVDLDALRADLAELAARRELGTSTVGTTAPARLELKLSAGNWAAAGFMGIFSLGWLSFTTFHAFLMIGGMMSAFGWGALALLAFYGIFWAVGFGMAWGALQAASSEALELEGRELTIRRRLGFWTRERKYTLAPDSQVYPALPDTSTPNPRLGFDMAALDQDGREIRFGRGCPAQLQEQYIARLNDYLAAQRHN